MFNKYSDPTIAGNQRVASPDTTSEVASPAGPANDSGGFVAEAAESAKPAADAPSHVSERKLEANRRNAQASTGPRTEAGKRNSRKNALKHGALSKKLLFDDQGILLDRDLHEYWQRLEEEYPCDSLYEEFLRDDLLFAHHGYSRTIQLQRRAANDRFCTIEVLAKIQRYGTAHRKTMRENFGELNELKNKKVWEDGELDWQPAPEDELPDSSDARETAEVTEAVRSPYVAPEAVHTIEGEFLPRSPSSIDIGEGLQAPSSAFSEPANVDVAKSFLANSADVSPDRASSPVEPSEAASAAGPLTQIADRKYRALLHDLQEKQRLSQDVQNSNDTANEITMRSPSTPSPGFGECDWPDYDPAEAAQQLAFAAGIVVEDDDGGGDDTELTH
jgi:hypothetical protein